MLYRHADESFYLRQIVRATGIGLGPVQRELKQLTDAGIIRRSARGRQVYYQANPACPVFSELKGIVVKTAGVGDVLRDALAPVAGHVNVAFIFGSIVGGNEHRASDIDMMVVGDVSFGEVVSLLSSAEERLGRETNTVVYPVAEFRQKVRDDHHFVKSVLEGDKIFLIGDERELAGLVAERLVN